MSSIRRIALPLAAICITTATFLAGATSAHAFQLGAIPESGSPIFVNSVKVRANVNNQTVKAFTNGSGRDFELQGTTLGTIAGRGSFTLNASYTGEGILSSGSVQIKGSMDSIGITGGGNILYSADLNDWETTDSLWGFGTTNIFCHELLEAAIGNCTTDESVYITLNSLFGGFDDSYSGSGTAYSTIPIPAAAWLFGSALGLLGWVRRRTSAAV